MPICEFVAVLLLALLLFAPLLFELLVLDLFPANAAAAATITMTTTAITATISNALLLFFAGTEAYGAGMTGCCTGPSVAPQLGQNLAPGTTGTPHLGQFVSIPPQLW